MNEHIKPIRLGGIWDAPNQTHQAGSVYDPSGISPAIDTCGGGNRMPMVVENEQKL